MPIYTFESDHSPIRIKGKTVIADSSYLIALSEKNKSIRDFHENALDNEVVFYINMVARQEFIKQVRKVQLIETIIALASSDKVLEQRYRDLLGMPDKEFTVKNLDSTYDRIFKNHVQKRILIYCSKY